MTSDNFSVRDKIVLEVAIAGYVLNKWMKQSMQDVHSMKGMHKLIKSPLFPL